MPNRYNQSALSTSQKSHADEPVETFESKPLLVIDARGNYLNLNELWRYRDLFLILAWRDIKVRYKQTFLGVLWAIIQPLLLVVILTFVFGRLSLTPEAEIPYPLFVLAGLIPWNFFSTTIIQSGNSLVGNSNLITKVYFPRMIVPLATIAAGLVDLAILLGFLGVLLFVFGFGISVKILLLPLIILLIFLLIAGLGMWLAALNVKYRDIRHGLPFLIQIWMFVSPVIYPLKTIPDEWRWVFLLNPLTGIIEAFRAAVFNLDLNIQSLSISIFLTLSILIYSVIAFRRLEREFADLI